MGARSGNALSAGRGLRGCGDSRQCTREKAEWRQEITACGFLPRLGGFAQAVFLLALAFGLLIEQIQLSCILILPLLLLRGCLLLPLLRFSFCIR